MIGGRILRNRVLQSNQLSSEENACILKTNKNGTKVLNNVNSHFHKRNAPSAIKESKENKAVRKKEKGSTHKIVSVSNDKENKVILNNHSETNLIKNPYGKNSDLVHINQNILQCKINIIGKKYTEKIPIWKKAQFLHKSLKTKTKKLKNYDIYDISGDDDFLSEKLQPVKRKNIADKQNKKKTVVKIQNEKKKNARSVRYIPVDSKHVSQQAPAHLTSNNVNVQNNMNLNDYNNEQNFLGDPDNEGDFELPSVEKANVKNLDSKKHTKEKNAFLSHFVEEFEKSIIIPKMTSTPHCSFEGKPPKCKIPLIQVADLSRISCTDKQKNDNISVLPNSIKINYNSKKMSKEDNIILFESPTKQNGKKNASKLPKKPIQINLFNEDVNSPTVPAELNESVLKPKKAYHTPDNFKHHIPRTKRSKIQRQNLSKSRQDLQIEKLTQHFDEINDMDLFIE